ncbi:MAG: hypothetical protein NTZ65_01475 [Candidatus Berkelbacteria bacterium]|nr:hypothetical protein [Candidatus Berkelbacteria bacterium]
MDENQADHTQGSAIQPDFISVKNSGEETSPGTEKNIDKVIEDKGPGGFVIGLVDSFEKKFPTAFFILVVVGYIIIESFGSHNIRIYQYSAVILVSLIFYCFLKYSSEIFGWFRRIGLEAKNNQIATYLVSFLVVAVLCIVYYYFGTPKLYFEKRHKIINSACVQTQQFIKGTE